MDRNVTIIRSKRKTVAIQIKSGEIIVKTPLQMKTTEIQELLEQKKGMDSLRHIFHQTNTASSQGVRLARTQY